MSHAVNAAFAAFISSRVRDENVLLEISPRLVLSGFSATGAPYSNTYQMSVPNSDGGVFRKVTGVRENATDLTERTSVSDVNANAGSWYWDISTGILYVRSSTGSDPDTFSAYQAIVKFFFSTKPVVLLLTDGDASTATYYRPWVVGTLPELVERDNDSVFGTKITQGGDITMLNTGGWWNTVVAHDGDYRWKNAKVDMCLGGSYGSTSLLRSQYEHIASYLVEDLAASEEEVVLSVHPLVLHLNESIPKTPYFSSSYPNLGEGVEGTKKWVGYGRAVTAPDLTDDSGTGVYTIADAAYQTLFAVNAVYAVNRTTGVRSTLTETTHYTVDLTACTLTVTDATYTWQDYIIQVDVTGKPDGAGSYIKTFPDIVEDILLTFLGVRASDIDSDSFLDYTDTTEYALWVKSPRTVASIMSTVESGMPCLENPVGGMLAQTHEGQWKVSEWDPSYDPTVLSTFRKSDFASFKPDPDLSSVFSKVNVYYDYNHASGTWKVESASDARQGYLQDTQDQLDIYTFLRNATDALTLAERMLVVATGKVLNIDVEEAGAKLSTYQVREKLLMDYDPAPVASGSLSQYPMEVVELRRSFDPTLKVTARLGNLRGIGQFIGRWADSAAPDYSSATPAERAVSGFWSDPSGYVVPSDPSTLDISLWW